MYFVLKQHQELGRTFDVNVRMGGFRTMKAALGAAKRNSPAIIRDDHRQVVAQTLNAFLPGFIK